MPEQEQSKIQIRCPKCSQRFLVATELRGRMVECGGCEHRFRVEEPVFLRGKKFYPGERKDPALMRFTRPAMNETSGLPDSSFSGDVPPASDFGPTPFSRVLVGLAGGSLMALMLLILIVGASNNGMLDGVTTQRRLVMAGFAAIVGGLMLVYANPRAKAKATFFAVLTAGLLLLTPLYFRDGSDRDFSPKQAPEAFTSNIEMADYRQRISEMKLAVGYAPVERALVEAGPNGKVLAIWLKGLRESNLEMVQNFLLRVSGAEESSHVYPRLTQHYLFVLINPKLSTEEMMQECERLGVVDQNLPELHLIDVAVKNERFTQQPMAKLTDKKDGAFYQLNLRELQGIDLRRINEALMRLSLVEPTQSRDDITKRLIQLLGMNDREMFANVCRTLMVWSTGQDLAPRAVMEVAKNFYQKDQSLPREAVAFLVKWQQPEIYPILDQLWEREPRSWEELYMKSGKLAEERIIRHLSRGSKAHRMSAARISGRVGRDKAIAALEQLIKSESDLELQASYANARDAIVQRLR